MFRCVLIGLTLSAATLVAQAQAVVARQFPATALRGEMVFGQPPEVLLNGKPARMVPASRIRGTNNLLVLSGSLIGTKAMVHYTLDTQGFVKDVWILRDDELKKPWPRTAEEASRWQFEPISQTWTPR
ncbi:MAG: hypothetical protein N2040_10715 [Caldimonas manganoxidans]|uniref:hypothetical protein n=1 Tax=Caldimonas TaxID=196013 RepID=UPI00037F46E4|nr:MULTISPECIES: hypothetical protein [Caldimonas]MCX7661008.1 hypothetical protein [Caldimonas manganoxidans]GIX25547.1 MAG: hypothetical protein KatS3mg122_2778 [Caldimonas sp.]